MNKADAIELFNHTIAAIRKDPADVQELFCQALEDALLSSEAPGSEALTVIWSNGYISGLMAAMTANRIPPLDTPENIHKYVEGVNILFMEYMARIERGKKHAEERSEAGDPGTEGTPRHVME